MKAGKESIRPDKRKGILINFSVTLVFPKENHHNANTGAQQCWGRGLVPCPPPPPVWRASALK